MCQLTIYAARRALFKQGTPSAHTHTLTAQAADHGLGLLDFSDWEAVKERWKAGVRIRSQRVSHVAWLTLEGEQQFGY